MEKKYMQVLVIVAIQLAVALRVTSTINNNDDSHLYPYGRGVGRIPSKRPCPAGLRDDGTSCWNDAHIYGKGCCCTIFGCCNKCRSGYHDDGCTCRKTGVGIKITLFQRLSCNADEEKYGSLCYKRCKVGFHPVGCCICEPDAKF